LPLPSVGVSTVQNGGERLVRPGPAVRKGGMTEGLGGIQLTPLVQDHRNDEAVDAKHTSHDDRDEVPHDLLRVGHAHGSDAHARLGSSISGADIYKVR